MINGHLHNIEVFAPQTPTGNATKNGIREVVIGTGGKGASRFFKHRRHSEFRSVGKSGVLDLILHKNGTYDAKIVTVDNKIIHQFHN